MFRYNYYRDCRNDRISYEVNLNNDGSVYAVESSFLGGWSGGPENGSAFYSVFDMVANHQPDLLRNTIEQVKRGDYCDNSEYRLLINHCKNMINETIQIYSYGEDGPIEDRHYVIRTEKGLRGPIFSISLYEDGSINASKSEKGNKKEYSPDNWNFESIFLKVAEKYPELYITTIEYIKNGKYHNQPEYQEVVNWCNKRYLKEYEYTRVGVTRTIVLKEKGCVEAREIAYEGGLNYSAGERGFFDVLNMVGKENPEIYKNMIFHIKQGEYADKFAYKRVIDHCKAMCDKKIKDLKGNNNNDIIR